jgi:hypothetical protein
MENFQINDLVALLAPVENEHLEKGQVGTIVDILEENEYFLVEFSNKKGETVSLLPLNQKQILLLHLNNELVA